MKRLIFFMVLVTACNSENKPASSQLMSANEKFHLLQKAATVDLTANAGSELTKERLVELCYADDIQFERAEDIYKKLQQNWNSQSIDKIVALVGKDFEGSSFSRQNVSMSQDVGQGITLQTLKSDKVSIAASAFREDLKNYFAGFKAIRSVRFEPMDYKIGVRDRNTNLQPTKFVSDLNYYVKGIDSKGMLREDRGTLTASLVNVDNKWLLQSLKLKDSLRLTKSGSHFKELDLKTAGLDSLKSYERLEAIRRGGYTLALSDFNNDGHQDFLLGSYGKLQLYKGAADGKFVPVKDSGIEEYTLVKSAIFSDLNNDGHKDLLIVRFVEMDGADFDKHVKKQTDEDAARIDKSKTPHVNSVVIYKNLGNGKFEKASELVDSLPAEHAMPATIADFDNDGLLDIYIGYPGVKDFTTFTNDAPGKMGKKAQGVYLNKGDFTFVEKAMNTKKNYEVFSEENLIYPHSAIAVDYNQDGHMDIVVVDDRGNLSVAYKNLGKANFVMDNTAIDFQNYGIGMGLSVADFNNDGKIDMALTNVAFKHRNRLAHSCQANWNVDVKSDDDLAPREAMRLFQASGDKTIKMVDVTNSTGIVDVGDGLGGVEFLDYDNDGLQDFYIANGLWTGTSPTLDLSGLFNRALKHYVEEGIYEGPVNTRSFMMDILANYRDAKGQTASMAGYQENKLFRNLGNGKFIEVGYLEGVDSIADGYVVGTADINNDGVIDLVLRNADPGIKDVKYPPLQIFLGQKTDTKSVQISLEGRVSNRDGVGAQLTGKVQGMPIQVRQLLANNGTIQSQQLLWFSLGKNEKLDELTIRWPSGQVQTLKNLAPGRHHIVEAEQGNLITKN
ncbi:MAG: CRTAC1 family protein [Candidatus Caldatribacteriota bacterium]